MYKSDLYEAVSEDTEVDAEVVRDVINSLLNAVMIAVAEGEKVVLTGFGTIDRKRRAAKRGIHPGTGEPIKIPSRWAVTFNVGKNFKDRVRGED